jgi:tetratricopeptide (TPR) repeat protein
MGFGKKTDYETGRTLDLDATYNAIISLAATAEGLRCIRSDEIVHSGLIDVSMYEMLLRAELVIADISTGNVNAVYELGVRHALRPHATIIMKEDVGRLYFDLDHSNTFQYEHLGKDIGHSEAIRAQTALRSLIQKAMASPKTDSPVYTYLPGLQQPRMTESEYSQLLDEAEAVQEKLSALIQSGQQAFKDSLIDCAVKAFSAAAQMKPGEPYLVQQLALATYKAGKPSRLDALIEGLRIIDQLGPDKSNDPETLGITGAIRKRLWQETGDLAQLDAAIRYYGRGFEVTRDYYNGENLAVCYDFRSELQIDQAEAQYDALSARKIRSATIDILTNLITSPSFDQRSDTIWIYATLANCLFALNRNEEAQQYEKSFFDLLPANWEIETYNANKKAVLKD